MRTIKEVSEDYKAEIKALKDSIKEPELYVKYNDVVSVLWNITHNKEIYTALSNLPAYEMPDSKPKFNPNDPYRLGCVCKNPEPRTRHRSRRDPFDDDFYYGCLRASEYYESEKKAIEGWKSRVAEWKKYYEIKGY